ncbi:helix-turn-helix domain-containing protein [Enterococcus avium]|uniref:helix-turn-helix domain-containing protein n=1 Tax=Enterococcus avium TaxID=33945 RepID=UPI001F566EB5|nr:helix-turn-helix domain-containing protein [Enterococcus avium]
MIRLIYEKSSRMKVEIVRVVLENRGTLKKEKLLNYFNVSSATLDKYLLELYLELPSNSIEITKSHVLIDNIRCSLYDIQILYFSKSITKEILHMCFFSPALTLEGLAQELYISTSKLFTVLKFLECQLKKIDIKVLRTPLVSIIGKAESILILYNLLLHLEDNPFQVAFSKLNEKLVVENTISFFEENHFKVEHKVVREFGLWLVAISDRYYLKKMFENPLEDIVKNNFLDFSSPVCNSFQKHFSCLNYNGIDLEGTILAVNFLLFNTIEIHFESIKDEFSFFKYKVKPNFSYHTLILSILLKAEYAIDSQNLIQTVLKVEGSLHYYNLLYPYFDLYGEFFNPKLKKSPKFQKLILQFKKDFNSFFQKEIHLSNVNEKIFEFLAHVVSAFQKEYFPNTYYRIGVYSMKGTVFEKKICEELSKAIEIVPYSEFENSDDVLDLLIIDDLRLLSNVDNYKKYILFGDYYQDKLRGDVDGEFFD